MGLILKQFVPENIAVSVWRIEETEDFFFNRLHLFPDDEMQIKRLKLQKVRLQKLACRAVLASLLGSNEVGITYTETGQPQLQGGHISFAHTEKCVAVAFAKIPVGIDIEELTPRILPLYTRFMSPQEIADCNLDNLEELYYFWCAKEAMYKWFSQKNIDFIKDLKVIKNENKGIVCNTHALQLTTLHVENHLIVVCN